MAIVLSQLFHYSLHPSIKNLYYRGKGYELLSLYFNRSEDPNAEQCPFLIDEENVLKIKKAKEIILANMAEPPGLQELADEVGLTLKKLKMGFKQIEVSYPSASDTDFNFTRKLIEEDLVPDDVAIQILIPAKKEWIKKSIEAMSEVKNGIFHLYNPTNEFQRRVVFQKSDDEIIQDAHGDARDQVQREPERQCFGQREQHCAQHQQHRGQPHALPAAYAIGHAGGKRCELCAGSAACRCRGVVPVQCGRIF